MLPVAQPVAWMLMARASSCCGNQRAMSPIAQIIVKLEPRPMIKRNTASIENAVTIEVITCEMATMVDPMMSVFLMPILFEIAPPMICREDIVSIGSDINSPASEWDIEKYNLISFRSGE
jgi:hypothetical protein